MREPLVVGILKESKPGESRAPLSPTDVRWLKSRKVSIEVQTSPERVFKDTEYKKSGARLVKEFKRASLLVGVKEPDCFCLRENSVYMVFSHTAKGQEHNRALLRECMKKKITLVDYEKITDTHGRRLVYFGRFAGICGIADSLYYLGMKLEHEGIKNPFSKMRPANRYRRIGELKRDMVKLAARIHDKGLDKKITPFIIGVTGHGNVSSGVSEILELLNPIEIHPGNMRSFVRSRSHVRNRLYKISFHRGEKFRAKDGGDFYLEEYMNHPRRFESNLDTYLADLNILIHASYWDKRYPRLISKEMVRKLYKRTFRLKFIGDLACDINGSIELTYKATTIDNPTYTYDPVSGSFTDGYKGKGITVLARDNIPVEMPLEASKDFSGLVREYVYQIAAHGVKDVSNHVALPREIRKAVIVENRRIAGPYDYLKKSI